MDLRADLTRGTDLVHPGRAGCRPVRRHRLPLLLDEIARVLRRDKFRRYLTVAEVEAFVEDLHERVDLYDDPTEVPEVSPDPDDDFLVALAREANADALVSGDSDLADLELPDLPTLRPATFLRELASPREEAP